jgi:SAM-dependent methyltransferase
MIDELKYLFVKHVYADHNDSRTVRQALSELLAELPADSTGLNVGAGRTRLDNRIKNLEIAPGENIDYVGSVESIPCDSESFDLVITQEVLEHVPSPQKAMAEIYRVLKKGGRAYVQLPFVIGYHPCPSDYWRFTHEGIVELAKSADFEIVKTAAAIGPAVGFYRILVEFLAIVVSIVCWRLYKPAKAIFSILCYPVKLLDPLLSRSRQAMRISGGYFVICRKP